MRFAVGVGLALAVCGAGGAVAADAETKKTVGSIKVASAKSVAQSVTVEAPVTKTALATPPARVKARAVAPSLVARIDLNRQRMQVTSNGRVVGSWKISSGKRGHATPPGRFRPQWSSKMHYSRKYNNSPMPYSVFFNGGIATHGTGYTSRLGGAASHGCIRLRTANARKFYQLVHRHGYKRTRIIVTGRAKTTRTASRTSVRKIRTAPRRNSFAAPRARRHSLNTYDRRRMAQHQRRVNRYYQSRRMVYPGDRR
ncbi:MAG: lipoprotein-anchoring transpeptidase ErfK/SrfK [Hyphomicrobiaceae bacterium]|jgi:lipoprotein-anchoring transpeptidase ErfK/SrfK